MVCLPCDHEGGQLVLRHKKTEMDFDWSINAADPKKKGAINWAAFYSDVEHEVLQVTSGHRITLTYNLYVAHGSGALAGKALSFDPKQLPLCGIVEEMLRQPAFLSKGQFTFDNFGLLLNMRRWPAWHLLRPRVRARE